jgi:lipopolysaccharide transport system ATP-binding protein
MWSNPTSAPGDDRVRLKSVRVINERGELAPEVDIRQPIVVEVDYWNLSSDPDFRPYVNLHFFNAEGVCLFVSMDANNTSWRKRRGTNSLVTTRCHIPGNYLAEGTMFVTTAISSLNPTTVHVYVDDAVAAHISDPSEGDGVRGEWTGDWPGVVRPLLEWEATQSAPDSAAKHRKSRDVAIEPRSESQP